MRHILVLAALLFAVGPLQGVEPKKSADLQMRIPFHVQVLPQDYQFGIAAWTALPNVFAKDNETALLVVGGPLFQYDKKGSWIELMGGTKIDEDGYKDPLINIRFLDKTIPHLNIGSDLEYFPEKERCRFYSLTYIDTPIPWEVLRARIGVESENIFSFTKKKDSLGIGPRLSYAVPIPYPKLSAAITASYQWRNDRDFARIYLSITYKPFAKAKK